MSGETRAQRAIGHTQVRLQPEPGADMHRLAALSTRKCTLAAYTVDLAGLHPLL